MDNKVLGLIIGGIVAAVLTVLGVVYMVTGGEDAPAPAPVTSSAPAPDPVETNDPLRDILEQTWNEQSYGDQQLLCTFYKVDPNGAFNSFNEGSEGLLPRSTFDEFFTSECATI